MLAHATPLSQRTRCVQQPSSAHPPLARSVLVLACVPSLVASVTYCTLDACWRIVSTLPARKCCAGALAAVAGWGRAAADAASAELCQRASASLYALLPYSLPYSMLYCPNFFIMPPSWYQLGTLHVVANMTGRSPNSAVQGRAAAGAWRRRSGRVATPQWARGGAAAGALSLHVGRFDWASACLFGDRSTHHLLARTYSHWSRRQKRREVEG